MRVLQISLLGLFLVAIPAYAQSITDNMSPGGMDSASPPAPPNISPYDPYTITDVSADVTADTAAHARDKALTQAEHMAFVKLCVSFNEPENTGKLNDDAVAALVQSVDIQSEKLSAVRYIGVFTIHFRQVALQKKLGHYRVGEIDQDGYSQPPDAAHAAVLRSASHIAVLLHTPTLLDWVKAKNHLASVPQIVQVDMVDLGRGISHIDLHYTGSLDNLQPALVGQGLVLHKAMDGEWEIVDSDNSWGF